MHPAAQSGRGDNHIRRRCRALRIGRRIAITAGGVARSKREHESAYRHIEMSLGRRPLHGDTPNCTLLTGADMCFGPRHRGVFVRSSQARVNGRTGVSKPRFGEQRTGTCSQPSMKTRVPPRWRPRPRLRSSAYGFSRIRPSTYLAFAHSRPSSPTAWSRLSSARENGDASMRGCSS